MLKFVTNTPRPFKGTIIAKSICRNGWNRIKFLAGCRGAATGSTHRGLSLTDSLSYINEVFDDYIRYSGITPEALVGARVLEIGPGDNFGVALKFLMAGASKVVCLDKFFSHRDPVQQSRIYRAIWESLDDRARQVFDGVVTLGDNTVDFDPEALRYICGAGIEDKSHDLAAGSCDLIVSRAVMQDVGDIDAGFDVMDRLLAPGGLMLHKIDLRDYGLFSGKGWHPLTFLTIPDWLYRLMTSDSAEPNRRMISDYRKKLNELGYETTLHITRVIGEHVNGPVHRTRVTHGVGYSDATLALIDEIRPKFLARYQAMPDEELMVSGIFVVAKKPP